MLPSAHNIACILGGIFPTSRMQQRRRLSSVFSICAGGITDAKRIHYTQFTSTQKKKNTRALKITQVFFSYSCGSESNKLYTSTRGHKRLLYVRKCFFLDNVANTSLQLCSQTQKKSQHPVFPRRGKGFLDADHKKTTVQDSRRQNTVGTENKEVNPPRLPCCLVPS